MAPPAILEYADQKNDLVVTKVANVTTECNRKTSQTGRRQEGYPHDRTEVKPIEIGCLLQPSFES